MALPSRPWLQRFIARYEHLMDDDDPGAADGVARLIREATTGDWQALSRPDRTHLKKQVRRALKLAAMAWADPDGEACHLLSAWDHALDGDFENADAPEGPASDLPWLQRCLDGYVRNSAEQRNAENLGVRSLIERAAATDWRALRAAGDLPAIQARLSDGGTLLHRAAQFWPEAIEAMLAAGADPLVCDREGRTAADLLNPEEACFPAVRALLEQAHLEGHLPAVPEGRRGARL